MKFDNQLRYAVNIINDYDGKSPLSLWLKDFFREHKQMGSRDRKTVSELVYGYYRLGHSEFEHIEERILSALYAIHHLQEGNHLKEVAEYFKSTHPGIAEYAADKIFPWKDLLSEGIDADAFTRYFLIQPDLFIRIRPGKEIIVLNKLHEAGISFNAISNHCIALPNSTKIDSILKLNEEFVVQDKSSQQTGELLNDIFFDTVWDCCAASGGKSIMVHDLHPKIDLTVSDIRESIIANLKTRFKEAGIDNYRSVVTDVASATNLSDRKYDLIIADVPCTGSGTWSRTPEQLYFFKEEKISFYSGLQKRIVHNILPKLNKGGHLLYITCSVFKKENEEIVNEISSHSPLKLLRKELIKGYNDKADTMFSALFQAV